MTDDQLRAAITSLEKGKRRHPDIICPATLIPLTVKETRALRSDIMAAILERDGVFDFAGVRYLVNDEDWEIVRTLPTCGRR